MARVYDITFQVWRPYYSLVGENVFASFTFTKGGFVELSPTPPSNSIITAQTGDVVGYYTNSRDKDNQGIQVERNTEYAQNIIWYKELSNTCPLVANNMLSVGSGGMLSVSTKVAPALKVSTSKSL